MENKIYTIEETADLLKVSQQTIRKYIKCGTLEANRITNGRRLYITMEAINNLLQQGDKRNNE